MKLKQNFLLAFYLLAGIIAGALLASLCQNVSFLQWLSFSGSIGFNPNSPFILDLSIFSLTFGFSMNISVAQIITIGLAIFLYRKTRK